MKYCLHCGGEVSLTSPGAYVCQKCSTKLYDNPIPGVAAIVLTYDHKLVFGRRTREPKKDDLDCLGGFVDEDETLEAALYRELYEEGGIAREDIVSMDYLTSVCDVYPWQPKAHNVTSAYFIVQLKADVVVKPADDISTIETYDLDDIDPDLFAWEGMHQAYTEFKKLFTDL